LYVKLLILFDIIFWDHLWRSASTTRAVSKSSAIWSLSVLSGRWAYYLVAERSRSVCQIGRNFCWIQLFWCIFCYIKFL